MNQQYSVPSTITEEEFKELPVVAVQIPQGHGSIAEYFGRLETLEPQRPNAPPTKVLHHVYRPQPTRDNPEPKGSIHRLILPIDAKIRNMTPLRRT